MGEVATLPGNEEATEDAEGQQRLFEIVVHKTRTSLAPAGDPVRFDAEKPELGARVRFKGEGYVSSIKFAGKDGVVTERRTIVYEEVTVALA